MMCCHGIVFLFIDITNKFLHPVSLSKSAMSSGQPLFKSLLFWCLLDLIVNVFVLINLVLCQILIFEEVLSEEYHLCPSLLVRVCALVTLSLVIFGDLMNLIGLLKKNLTWLVLWQMSFYLYFFLAYITLVVSMATTVQMVLDFQVRD